MNLESIANPSILSGTLLFCYFRLFLDFNITIPFLSSEGILFLVSLGLDVLFGEGENVKDLRLQLWGVDPVKCDRLEGQSSPCCWSTAFLLSWMVIMKASLLNNSISNGLKSIEASIVLINSLVFIILLGTRSFSTSRQKTTLTIICGVCAYAISAKIYYRPEISHLLGIMALFFGVMLYFLQLAFPKSFTLIESAIIGHFCVLALYQVIEYHSKYSGIPIEAANLKVSGVVVLLSFISVSVIASAMITGASIKTIRFLKGWPLFTIFTLSFVGVLYSLAPPFNFISLTERLIEIILDNTVLIGYWLCILLVSLPIIFYLSGHSRKSSLIQNLFRKSFHFLIVAILVPGVLLNKAFVSLSCSLILLGFIILEVLRFSGSQPFAPILNKYLSRFINEYDKGSIIISHIYLLLAVSIPIWLRPKNLRLNLAGCTSIGIGDSLASIFGHLLGSHKWPGSKKTLEGTIFSIIGMLLFSLGIQTFEPANEVLAPQLLISVTLIGLWEALSDQNDNLTLPLVSFLLLQ